ncbi:MAG TPA: response regulator [Acidimicrobiales bacterium]|nr:response regulator [Acidimicrobiales bacterium]
MVVDDEPDLRDLITMTLSFDSRVEVVRVAGSAEDALEAEAVDLVVLDHWLGGPVTGVEVAAALRARFPGVRVLLFTADADVEIDLRDGAIDAVVAKPDLANLPDAVVDLMSR